MIQGAIAIGAGAAPERTCVGCGRKRAQATLVRFTRGPAGLRVHLERGEGRGVYLCPDADCLGRAAKRKTLQRALGAEIGPVSVSGLREAIHQAVLQKVRGLLGRARRAGRVVAGSGPIAQALEAGRVRLLLLSRDVFVPGGGQFQVEAERRGIPVVTVLSREDLGAAYAGSSREAIGLLDGGFAEGMLQTLRHWIA